MVKIFFFIMTSFSISSLFSQSEGNLDVRSTEPNTASFNGPDFMYISFFENNIYRGYLGSYSGAKEDMDLGTGTSNLLGKLHLTTQALPRLTVDPDGKIGIGQISPAYKLDVNGSLGINGALYLGGQSGSTGQVLVSNGSSSEPEWQTPPLANNTRFGIRMQKVGSASNTLDVSTTYYNNNSTDVNIGTSSITINKTGLYHFNGYMTGLLQGSFSNLPEMTCDMILSGSMNFQYDLMQWYQIPLRTQVINNYYLNEPFELEMHIIAPTTITFVISFLSSSTPSHLERNLRLFAHLISE